MHMKQLRLKNALFVSALCIVVLTIGSCNNETEQSRNEAPDTEMLETPVIVDTQVVVPEDTPQFDSSKSEQTPPAKRRPR